MAIFTNVNMLGPVFTSLASLSIALVVFIFGKQPDPYMDEVFHITQAQRYCKHRFNEWDPMITTLPGLYFCSWPLMELLAVFLNQDVKVICMPLFLRMTNIIFNVGNIWVMYRILRKLNEKPQPENNQSSSSPAQREDNDKFYLTSTAVTLGVFPLLFFFMFLYYTDNGSTFFVLLMYYLSLGDYHLPAGIVGLYAIFFRQTNVVWVVFTAGVTAVRIFEPAVLANLGPHSEESIKLILEFIRLIISNLKLTIRILWPYALDVLFFAAFVFLNGGVAVGDRAHHRLCFNFPQVFYFACFAAFFSFPHFSSPRTICDTIWYILSLNHRRYRSLVILALFSVYYVIQNFTYVHFYLLADNRHYTFYIWKNIFKAYPEAKIALIPVYLVATIALFVSMDRSRLWKVVYGVSVMTVLIPQGLLEFRYFILPYLMFRLHLRKPELWKLGAEFLIYAVINYFTLFMFLKKPFYWPNSKDVQRFMW